MSIDPTGLIDFFEHPPIGMLQTLRLDQAGPYTGNLTVTHYDHPTAGTHLEVKDTYGVLVQLSGSYLPKLGLELGWVSDDGQYSEDRYELRLVQVVTQHQTPSGLWITTQVDNVANFAWPIFWREALPGRIGLRTLPGISVDLLYWPKPLA